MKTAKLGDFLLWRGELAKIVGTSDGYQVIIEPLKNCSCPHCGGDLGKKQIQVLVSSPNFQNGAEPIQTISDE